MKQKIIIFFLGLIISVNTFSQTGIDGLVQSEKDFAVYSVAHGTKEAFLKFADSAGIVFDNGTPLNAIEIWSKRPKRPGKLDWAPEYAEIASSGNFGFTTGPWSFSIHDTIVSTGYYITVWHADKNGKWKFLVDLGVGDINCDFTSIEKTSGKSSPSKGTRATLEKAENDFIASNRENQKQSYSDQLSRNSRLYRNKLCAAISDEPQQEVIDLLPSSIGYTVNGSGIASSGDLGYVYGTTIINGKTDNYLRIWRYEKNEWKIALEVLRY